MKRSALTLSVLGALSLSLPALASAKELVPANLSSNSELVDKDKNISYAAANAGTQLVNEMWVEGEGSAGLGKYVKVEFDGEVEVAKIRIWAGCFSSQDFWKRHNRIAAVEIKYPDFTSEKFEIEDKMEPQWLTLAEPKTLDNLKIYLRQVYSGTTWNDTPITRIQFFDKAGVEGIIEGTTATASSSYADDKDGNYTPDKAVDGWLDTRWVNGEGSGDKDWIEVDLGGKKQLTKFGIVTGFDDTESFFKGSNRVARIKLQFDGGKAQTFDLKDERGLQTFELSGVSASKVKASFPKVAKGDAHDDLYVGELIFWE